ncbi:MAG: signal peptide peptidase SppA [Alphaproteobacteria bacterium]|nr:signal peptide peptidase SppA [Alphaproteobacteria bacterium]
MSGFWNKIKGFAKVLCMVVGAVTLISLIGLITFGMMNRYPKPIEKNTYLTIDFNKPFSESDNSGIWTEFTDDAPLPFLKMLEAVEYAAADDNVRGLVAKINKTNLEPAQLQDIARAILRFEYSGKKTVVFSQGFGSLGQGSGDYYLASFFKQIYMQPHTYIGLTGISIEIPFLKNLLDKLGVTAEFYSRYEYKNAMASLTDTKISKAYAEEMTVLAQGLMSELELDIKGNRKLQDSFENIVNKAPLTAEEGQKLGLIDGIMYMSQLEDKLKADGAEHFVNIKDYAAGLAPNSGNLPTVALLNLSGEIIDGESKDSLRQDDIIGSESVVADIESIKKLPNLKAVVVRINSPGGSYNAADEIYFALKQLKEKAKVPVIVSQSAYAASGGYFISLAGDYIFAEPMTITGSIGVLGGKAVFGKLWKKLGVSWSRLNFGKNAGILSSIQPFSESEKKIFNKSLDDVYSDFTAKVAENRKLTQPMNKIARGRVWLGRQALDLGLIDELGSTSEAIARAMDLGKIGKNQTFKIVSYPKAKSFSEKLSDLIANTGSIKAEQLIEQSGVDITNLKLFKRLQYDTVMLPIKINM